MPKRFWLAALSFWPGLPQVWAGQEVLGVILALIFAAAVNLAVVSRWIWTEMFDPAWTGFFAILAIAQWFMAAGYTLWWVYQRHPERHKTEIDRLFRDALEFYLQGRWNESRDRCERILMLDEADADALMHLGAIFARTAQPKAARLAFRQCLELEGGAKWHWEISRALKRLEAVR